MVAEKVKLNDGSEVEIQCQRLAGRKAFQIGDEVFKLTSLKTDKEGNMSMDCDFKTGVLNSWPHIVAPCPQRDNVQEEDMQRIFEKYAKKQVDFAIKKKLENFNLS